MDTKSFREEKTAPYPTELDDSAKSNMEMLADSFGNFLGNLDRTWETAKAKGNGRDGINQGNLLAGPIVRKNDPMFPFCLEASRLAACAMFSVAFSFLPYYLLMSVILVKILPNIIRTFYDKRVRTVLKIMPVVIKTLVIVGVVLFLVTLLGAAVAVYPMCLARNAYEEALAETLNFESRHEMNYVLGSKEPKHIRRSENLRRSVQLHEAACTIASQADGVEWVPSGLEKKMEKIAKFDPGALLALAGEALRMTGNHSHAVGVGGLCPLDICDLICNLKQGNIPGGVSMGKALLCGYFDAIEGAYCQINGGGLRDKEGAHVIAPYAVGTGQYQGFSVMAERHNRARDNNNNETRTLSLALESIFPPGPCASFIHEVLCCPAPILEVEQQRVGGEVCASCKKPSLPEGDEVLPQHS